jgi:hypothetical protein
MSSLPFDSTAPSLCLSVNAHGCSALPHPCNAHADAHHDHSYHLPYSRRPTSRGCRLLQAHVRQPLFAPRNDARVGLTTPRRNGLEAELQAKFLTQRSGIHFQVVRPKDYTLPIIALLIFIGVGYMVQRSFGVIYQAISNRRGWAMVATVCMCCPTSLARLSCGCLICRCRDSVLSCSPGTCGTRFASLLSAAAVPAQSPGSAAALNRNTLPNPLCSFQSI